MSHCLCCRLRNLATHTLLLISSPAACTTITTCPDNSPSLRTHPLPSSLSCLPILQLALCCAHPGPSCPAHPPPPPWFPTTVHEPLEPEYSILKQRIARRLRHEGHTDQSVRGLSLTQLTQVAERTITDDLEHLISQSVDPAQADYAGEGLG